MRREKHLLANVLILLLIIFILGIKVIKSAINNIKKNFLSNPKKDVSKTLFIAKVLNKVLIYFTAYLTLSDLKNTQPIDTMIKVIL